MSRSRAFLCLALLAGCVGSPPPPQTFAEAFPETRRITLGEDPADPIVEITALDVAPNGDLIVTDQAASKVRVFSGEGVLLRTLGRPGEAPGELQGPRWAAAGPGGEIRVVQQGSPRITTFWPADSVTQSTLPGHYGFWVASSGVIWVVGAATRSTRFAVLSDSDGGEAAVFGVPAKAVNETPFWIFFAKDRGVLVRDQIWTNNSFSSELQVFDLDGSEVRRVGVSPPGWVAPTAPPIDRVAEDGDGQRIEDWASTFTVVSALAARGDSLVLVQYGRHSPANQDPYFVQPKSVDVYGADGSKRFEALELETRILAGGDRLYLLESQPPDGWVLTVH